MPSGYRIFGLLFVLFGLIVTAYHFFAFKTTVKGEPIEYMGRTIANEETYNIGLISQRQNGIVAGIGLANLGGLFLIAGRINPAIQQSNENHKS